MKRFPQLSRKSTVASVALVLALALLISQDSACGQSSYDPLQAIAKAEVKDDQFTYDDRNVPLRVYLPESSEPSPVLLLSHGLGGTREACTFLGKHWASRGYAVVAMQHAGSDFDVIKNAPRAKRFQALKEAASGANAKARNEDVKATIDFLEQQNKSGGKYAERFDLTKIGMSGHSFGAVTTQAVSGQSYGQRGQLNTDSRIDAACAFSPSPPTVGSSAGPFQKVAIPWMLMTGTKDDSPIGRNSDPNSRREVFKGLPSSGHFYELVLHGAEHSAFADAKRLRKSSRNPNHHKAIKALSTAFWDAHLKQDTAARKWLDTSEAKSVLEPKDEWQRK
ncbi:MAG: alpha/beta hydrolase family protein [Mariniblastus sp.]